MKKILKEEPLARERKNKYIVITRFLADDYPELKSLGLETAAQILKMSTSVNRVWQRVLQLNPELRGSDYPQIKKLERQKKKELGYNITNDDD